MVIVSARIAKPKNLHHPLFNLQIHHGKYQTVIRMELLVNSVTTRHIPHTYHVLKKSLPSILRAPCFNDEHLPFAEEVKSTEIGHLFEHMLLEYLSDLKFHSGVPNPIFNGTTNWNWRREKRGVFHIMIDAGSEDELLFSLALEKSIKLLQRILTGFALQSVINTIN